VGLTHTASLCACKRKNEPLLIALSAPSCNASAGDNMRAVSAIVSVQQ
jgi:hypothetical protein